MKVEGIGLIIRLGIAHWFALFCVASVMSSSDIGPEVTLSRAMFYTNHNFTNTSNDTHVSYLLPITFKALEFNCTATYPTSWKFVTAPYNDTRLKDISITKHRFVGNFSDRSTYRYDSTLRLNFKHATSIPGISCRNSRRKNGTVSEPDLITAVNSSLTKDEFRIQINVRRNVIYYKNRGRAGLNPDCKVTLNISLESQTFLCGTTTGGHSSPKIIHCNNPDECNSILMKDHCGNDTNTAQTFSKHCDSEPGVGKCIQLNLSNTPGVIICYDSKLNSIARRYLITQTHRGIHMHLGSDNDFEDETISLTTPNLDNMFTNQNVTFHCNGTGAYYSYGFQWAVNDSMGIIHYLGSGMEEYLEDLQVYNVTKTIMLNKELYGSCIQIVCYGPRWNLESWINATLLVDIKEPSIPHIIADDCHGECQTKSSEVTNASNFTCRAHGAPVPIFKWILEFDDRKSELENGSGTATSDSGFHCIESSTTGSIAETTLTIYFQMTDRHKVYCVARNFVGNDTKMFTCPIDGSAWIGKTWMTAALAVLSVTLILFTIGAWYLMKRLRRKMQLLSDDDIKEFEKGNPKAESALLLPYNMEFEIPREQILIENTVLGEGHFGMVLMGKIMKGGTLGPQQVAIKTYKKTADVVYLKALLSEIKIMSQVGQHPNLVNLIGASTRNLRKMEILVLIEFCSNGNLLKFLRKSRSSYLDYFNLSSEVQKRHLRMMERGLTEQEMGMRFTTTQNLLMWAYECANAMEYLSSKKVIHGDLAARNILLTETFHVKVCDFGLSKMLFDYSIYVQNLNCPLPLKWMAIESLQDLEFSVQSDVWSYGITLWEIFSLGQCPYPGIPQWNFQSYILLQSGYRMDRPEYANNNIYRMMLTCWDGNTESRPSFTELKDAFFRELHIIQRSSSLNSAV